MIAKIGISTWCSARSWKNAAPEGQGLPLGTRNNLAPDKAALPFFLN